MASSGGIGATATGATFGAATAGAASLALAAFLSPLAAKAGGKTQRPKATTQRARRRMKGFTLGLTPG